MRTETQKAYGNRPLTSPGVTQARRARAEQDQAKRQLQAIIDWHAEQRRMVRAKQARDPWRLPERAAA